jgi:hypothetical protein
VNLPHLRQGCAGSVPIVPKQAAGGKRRGPKPFTGELAPENRRNIHLRLPIYLVEEIRAESSRLGVPFVVAVMVLLSDALEGRGK